MFKCWGIQYLNDTNLLVSFIICRIQSRIVYFVKGEIPRCGTALPPLTKFSSDSAILVNSWLESIILWIYPAIPWEDRFRNYPYGRSEKRKMLSNQHTKFNVSLNIWTIPKNSMEFKMQNESQEVSCFRSSFFLSRYITKRKPLNMKYIKGFRFI